VQEGSLPPGLQSDKLVLLLSKMWSHVQGRDMGKTETAFNTDFAALIIDKLIYK